MSRRSVAIVTGASRGIGAATVLELARRGYDVALSARSEADLKKVAERAGASGARTLVLAGDLADLDYAHHVVEQTAQTWGRLDLLVNNAAWRELLTMRKISLESWEKTFRINVTAPAFMTRWAAVHMEKQRRGVVVNISSVMSQLAAGIAPAYIAAKGALDALTYDLAVLYGPRGIRVVSLRPGAIDTEMGGDYTDASGQNVAKKHHDACVEMTPLRRLGRPEEIARAVAFLAGDDASFITGTTVLADGGLQHHFSTYSLHRLMNPDEFP